MTAWRGFLRTTDDEYRFSCVWGHGVLRSAEGLAIGLDCSVGISLLQRMVFFHVFAQVFGVLLLVAFYIVHPFKPGHVLGFP